MTSDDHQRRLQAFGLALRKARERAGLTQRRLGALIAELEGLPEPLTGAAVGLWERGTTEPERFRVWAVERALELPPNTLSHLIGYSVEPEHDDGEEDYNSRIARMPAHVKAAINALIAGEEERERR